MGILEALKRERPGRIHDMILSQEEADAERKFDLREVEKVVDRVWSNLIGDLDGQREIIGNFYEMASFLYILKPEEKATLRLKENAWATLPSLSEDIKRGMSIAEGLNILSGARCVGEYASVKKFFADTFVEDVSWGGFGLQQIQDVFIIDPIFAKSLVDRIVGTDWQQMISEKDEHVEKDEMFSLALHAKNIKIIAPEKFSELHIEIHWSQMVKGFQKEQLEWAASDGWYAIARFAAALKIIAAKEVNITDDGIELIMSGDKTSHKETVTKRPIRQNF